MKNKASKFIKSTFCVAIVFTFFFYNSLDKSVTASDKDEQIQNEIETALFTEVEFFGTQTFVPFPTEIAKDNLEKISEKYPNEPSLVLQLARLNEKLTNFDKAEADLRKYIELSDDKIEAFEILANFYHQRANFEKEAEVFEKILQIASAEQRDYYFSNLIELAETNELEKYLKPEFYEEYITDNPFSFNVLERYLDKLIEEKNIEKALEFIRISKDKFPDKKQYFLEKEVSILSTKEAEKVYIESFDYFWSDEISNQFYDFLNSNDRLRAYGVKLREKYNQDKSDFDTAIRYIHFRKNDSQYGNDSAEDIVLQLERVRNEKQQKWTSDEFLTISRILLSEDNGDLASRYLYTLFLQDDVQQKGEMRAKVLYQLFEIFIDASSEKLALTKGDLKFYEDIAKADSNPGISTGILSLIFSDTNIRRNFEEKEEIATQLFNRSAAYRIFLGYKNEQPTSKQLAQMYLDIVRIYTAEKDLEIAEKTLAEFEQRFEHTESYADVALKLADAYIAVNDFGKERKTYQKILDFLGKNKIESIPLVAFSNEVSEPTSENPQTFKYPLSLNLEAKDLYSNANKYKDVFAETEEEVTYQLILTRLVSSLAKDNKTKEILAVYANEIKKYPNEQGLYEQLLQWLGRTNLTEKQLEIYNSALKKFPTKTWQDRLSRWFVRREKMKEFGELSNELLATFNDAETENYLSEFVDGNYISDQNTFNGQLHLGLYTLAHKRFPHNQNFVRGLLKFYKDTSQEDKWREMLAKYYFESKEIREEFLLDLAKNKNLREKLFEAKNEIANNKDFSSIPYKLFYADASRKLSNFEESVDTYKLLDELYPNTADFTETLIILTRSFGQKDRKILVNSAILAYQQSEFSPVNTTLRTRSGELQAELGNYEIAKDEWNKLLEIESGNNNTYLNTATIFWDYFQFEDAIQTIEKLRRRSNDDSIYACQMAAIYEAQDKIALALNEYIKALGNEENYHQASKRLTQLYKRDLSEQIQNAFTKEKQNPAIILGYARFLIDVDKEKGLQVVRQETLKHTSHEVLTEALSIFRTFDDTKGEQIALRQLAKTDKSPRTKISYELQLAKSFTEVGEKNNAANVLANLIQKYPTNYGVLTETSNVYWEMGEHEKAISILQIGIKRGIGKFQYSFGRKLAERLRYKNRFKQAENILLKLFENNKTDSDLFNELSTLFVQTNEPENLRKITDQTFAEIKEQNLEPRELKYEMIERRKSLIEAFTRLKDYDSAIEQHIEIINLEPELTENLDEAINYANRWGGAEILLNYYQKTVQAAYRNYRWFMVLGRLYEANKDHSNAIENYKIAIHNQPELPELYESLLQNYLDIKDTTKALETVDKLLELTNGQTVYLKRKIEILLKLGRINEAKIEISKLPLDEQKQFTDNKEKTEQFSRPNNSGKEESIKVFRESFAKLNQDPFKFDLRSSDITGYVEAIRQADDLNIIFKDFWNLRLKIIGELEKEDSTNAGKARDLLRTIDGTLPKAIGNIAKQTATYKELPALNTDFEQQINQVKGKSDRYKTLSFLHNLIEECDFDELKEKILIAKKDESFSVGNPINYHQNLRNLLDFYKERNDFVSVLRVLEVERTRDKNSQDFPFTELISENAKLLGEKEKEMQSLGDYFYKTPENIEQDNKMLERYFQLLFENDRGTLAKLAENNSKHRIQFINFLIEKGEKELTHKAIESSNFGEVWKLSRNAETSLIFEEFENANQTYFSNTLQIAPIGEMIVQKPKLTQKEWFRLSQTFGKWLYLANEKEFAGSFLTAEIENRPNDFKEQMRLGNFYLSQKNFRNAISHYQIAYELNQNAKEVYPKLGIAYFQTGELQKADEFWAKIIENSPTKDDALSYLKNLSEYGQSEKAKKKLKALFEQIFQDKNDDSSIGDTENNNENLIEFTKQLARTFSDESSKNEFFLDICRRLSKSTALPKILVEESIIKEENQSPFYEILINESESINSYDSDYEFEKVAENSFDTDELENLYEQESESEVAVPHSEKLNWQKEFLAYLLEQKNFAKAESLIRNIEESLAKKYVRPEWLRLATIELLVSKNRAEETINIAEKFIGIKVNGNAKTIKLPNIERMNEVLKILEKENKDNEISRIKREFYARRLALGNYETTSFIELSRNAFEQKDSEFGQKILELANDIAKGENSEKAQTELAKISLIKEFAVDAEKFAGSEQNGAMNYAETLRSTAEVLTEFGLLDEAKTYRGRLIEFDLEDALNRIEYARLSAEIGNVDEAITHLSYLIDNRNVTQVLRWKAVYIASEIIKSDKHLQAKLLENTKSLESQDLEIWNVLSSDHSIKKTTFPTSKDVVYESVFSKYLRANVALENNEFNSALSGFALVSTPNRQTKILQSFGFNSHKPLSQIIRIFNEKRSYSAILQIAESFDVSDANSSLDSIGKFTTLNERTRYFQSKSDLESLSIFSKAAENVGEVLRAIEFEEMRLWRIQDLEEKELIRERISVLKLKLDETNEVFKTSYKLGKENVSEKSFLE